MCVRQCARQNVSEQIAGNTPGRTSECVSVFMFRKMDPQDTCKIGCQNVCQQYGRQNARVYARQMAEHVTNRYKQIVRAYIRITPDRMSESTPKHMSEHIPDRLAGHVSDGLSGYMSQRLSGYMSGTCQTKCQNRRRIACLNISRKTSQIDWHNVCQILSVRICVRNMPGRMSECTPYKGQTFCPRICQIVWQNVCQKPDRKNIIMVGIARSKVVGGLPKALPVSGTWQHFWSQSRTSSAGSQRPVGMAEQCVCFFLEIIPGYDVGYWNIFWKNYHEIIFDGVGFCRRPSRSLE